MLWRGMGVIESAVPSRACGPQGELLFVNVAGARLREGREAFLAWYATTPATFDDALQAALEGPDFRVRVRAADLVLRMHEAGIHEMVWLSEGEAAELQAWLERVGERQPGERRTLAWVNQHKAQRRRSRSKGVARG